MEDILKNSVVYVCTVLQLKFRYEFPYFTPKIKISWKLLLYVWEGLNPYSHLRVEAHGNIRKVTAALCLVRSQPYSDFRVEAYCNVRNAITTLCLVNISTLFPLQSGSLLQWKKSDCCPVSGKVKTVYRQFCTIIQKWRFFKS